jgi:hypothetical protein
MKRPVVILSAVILLGFALGGFFAWLLAAKPPISQRALDAYNTGRYQDALPLFKQWAAQPDTRSDNQKLGLILAYIQDSESRIANPTTAPALTPSQLLAKAQSSLRSAPVSAPVSPSNSLANASDPATASAFVSSDPPSEPIKGVGRTVHTKPAPGEVVTLAIKQLGNFEFNPETDMDVPNDVKLLEGATIRLNGFMLPLSQSEKITEFALVPSLLSCCFGAPPGVEHTIMCRTAPNQAIDYAVDEIVVEGTLHIRPKRQDNWTYSLFELDVHSAKVKE